MDKRLVAAIDHKTLAGARPTRESAARGRPSADDALPIPSACSRPRMEPFTAQTTTSFRRNVCLIAGLVMTASVVACGSPTDVKVVTVPTTVVLYGGPGKDVPVFAAASITQLKALFLVAAPSNCPLPPADQLSCWPQTSQTSLPPSSLYIILPTPGGFGPRPRLVASIGGATLTLTQVVPPSSPGPIVMHAPPVSELVAIPLRDLPPVELSVVAPPWDGPGRYGGAALVDLQHAPQAGLDLASLVSQLVVAEYSAAADASRRLAVGQAGFVEVDRVGIAQWADNSLNCPGIPATAHTPVQGYILFLAQGGVPASPELEYHVTGTRAIYCGTKQ
jgi:hypothetical protein